jgi:outer membrane protein OmpA-like peptidoglycan-associated protein
MVSPKAEMKLTKTQYVNFVSGKSVLTAGSQAKIDSIIDRIKSMDFTEIEIVAFTDDVGSENFNLALSERRASAMKTLLISNGIAKSRIKAFGMGEENPIADNSTQQGKAINRRGELRIKFGSSHASR